MKLKKRTTSRQKAGTPEVEIERDWRLSAW